MLSPHPSMAKPPNSIFASPPTRLPLLLTSASWRKQTAPGTMADDEPVDPLTAIRETCGETSSCSAAMSQYKSCIERVTSKGFGTCEPWFFDYVKCIDKCAAPKIMKATK